MSKASRCDRPWFMCFGGTAKGGSAKFKRGNKALLPRLCDRCGWRMCDESCLAAHLQNECDQEYKVILAGLTFARARTLFPTYRLTVAFRWCLPAVQDATNAEQKYEIKRRCLAARCIAPRAPPAAAVASAHDPAPQPAAAVVPYPIGGSAHVPSAVPPAVAAACSSTLAVPALLPVPAAMPGPFPVPAPDAPPPSQLAVAAGVSADALACGPAFPSGCVPVPAEAPAPASMPAVPPVQPPTQEDKAIAAAVIIYLDTTPDQVVPLLSGLKKLVPLSRHRRSAMDIECSHCTLKLRLCGWRMEVCCVLCND